MRFLNILAPLLSSCALVSFETLAKRALTAQQVVDNINVLTQQTQDLQPVASAIQSGDTAISRRAVSGRQFTNPFEPLLDGFQGIIKTANGVIEAMGEGTSYEEADAKMICTAFTDFVVISQTLLNIVIGKSGLLEGLFQGPVAATLRSYDDTISTFEFGIIDSVPACQADASKRMQQLARTIDRATCAYVPGGSLGVNAFC